MLHYELTAYGLTVTTDKPEEMKELINKLLNWQVDKMEIKTKGTKENEQHT